MTPAVLTLALVVLVGARVRPRSRARRPVSFRGPLAPTLSPSPRRLSWRPPRTVPARSDPSEVATWCDGLARAIRSGSTLSAAIRDTDPPPGCSDDVEQIVLSLRRGTSLGAALTIDTDHPHLALALTVIRTCTDQGGPPAEPLDRVAATLRARAADLAERLTFSAQARLSAIVLTLLPVAMLGVLVITSASIRTSLATPLGFTIIAVGLVLNLLGWVWMRRIIDGGSR